MKPVAGILTLACAALGAWAGPVPVASAASTGPTCGSVLTADTTLTRNLTGCPGDGLVIGADDITLDLHGYVVGGDGVPGIGSPDVGIRLEVHRGVTITHGTVRKFDRGVALTGGRHNLVSRLSASANRNSGIALLASSDNVVRADTTDGSDVGIYLADGSTGNTVEATTSFGNEQGIALDGASANLVTHNRLTRNADNLVIGASGNRIIGNLISDAIGCGPDCGGYGVSLEAGQNNVISGNTVNRSLRDGIRVSAYDPDLATSGNVVSKNLVVHATGDGIAVATTGDFGVEATTLSHNVVKSSGGDGIHVNSPATTLSRNLAIHNALIGIEAVAGVLDRGGNRAFGNGGPVQCSNVRCQSDR